MFPCMFAVDFFLSSRGLGFGMLWGTYPTGHGYKENNMQPGYQVGSDFFIPFFYHQDKPKPNLTHAQPNPTQGKLKPKPKPRAKPTARWTKVLAVIFDCYGKIRSGITEKERNEVEGSRGRGRGVWTTFYFFLHNYL